MKKIKNFIKCILFRIRVFVKSNKTLYIIGNGFDIHHGLDTWYSSFGLYLQNNHEEIYDHLNQYIGMPELDPEDEESLRAQEWNEFEKSLANLYFDQIIDEHREYAAAPSSDDYYKDIGAIEKYVSDIKNNLTIELFKSFKEFIRQIDYPSIQPGKKLNIKTNAQFFNFNYTRSLQDYYSIQDSNILYIHNHAESDDTLVLGHGFDPDSFTPEKPTMPAGLTDEQKEEWYQRQDEMYDMSVDLGENALLGYFKQSYKDTDTIIEENEQYFDSLKPIKRIVIFGHSLAQVDEKYIQEIHSKVSSNCKWFVFYRNENEIPEKTARMVELGIKKSKIYLFNTNWLTKTFKK